MHVARTRSDVAATWGGVAGPAAFVTAWAALGATTAGYDPVHDPISRLAASGAGTGALMTAGFLAFAAGVAAHSGPLRRAFGRPTAAAALVAAAATAAVAALPLEGSGGGAPHAAAAGLAYVALTATPLLGGLALRRRVPTATTRKAVAWSFAAAAVTGASLAASALAPSHHGLLQRIGLTAGDAWLIASALVALGAGRARRTAAAASGGRSCGRSPFPSPTPSTQSTQSTASSGSARRAPRS